MSVERREWLPMERMSVERRKWLPMGRMSVERREWLLMEHTLGAGTNHVIGAGLLAPFVAIWM